MEAEWVIGQFTGKQAESVEGHANAGIGYFIVDTAGKGVNRTVVAAFRRICDSPTPAHLVKVTDPRKIEGWEKRRLERSGVHQRSNAPVSQPTTTAIHDIFANRKDLN